MSLGGIVLWLYRGMWAYREDCMGDYMGSKRMAEDIAYTEQIIMG